MKRIVAIAALATLVGCSSNGGGPADPGEGPTATVTVTETATVTATATTTATVTAAPEAVPTATETTGSASSTAAQKSDRGALIKQIGEEAAVVSREGEVLVKFAVTAIDPDYKCAETPENGKFVAFTIKAETTPALANEEWPKANFRDWIAVGADGKQQNGDPQSLASFGCTSEADRFPAELDPSVSAEGVVVFDVAADTGVLVLRLEGVMAWEWQY